MKRLSKAIVNALLLLSMHGAYAQGAPVIERAVDMLHWQERIFAGTTEYRGVILDGERVVRALAEGTASALYQRRRINLNRTPFLEWRWRVERTLGPQIDERSQQGDDFPARVYVVRNGGMAFWRAKALNYVWSSAQPVGARWDNPFGGMNVQMIAVDSGEAGVGEWQSHSRDIKADWLAAFGEEIDSLDAIAIMTDTDNTGITIRAWYADIFFRSEPLPAESATEEAASPSKD